MQPRTYAQRELSHSNDSKSSTAGSVLGDMSAWFESSPPAPPSPLPLAPSSVAVNCMRPNPVLDGSPASSLWCMTASPVPPDRNTMLPTRAWKLRAPSVSAVALSMSPACVPLDSDGVACNGTCVVVPSFHLYSGFLGAASA
eukprot:GFYU01047227.1.p2 GENE.GFYU01047227.1~~GFYU01047227.1.p2  ORF type:complete len:142 (+),score=2.52 GFYU01047227.1:85-510(+)